METISNILYWLSNGLLIPVTVFLLFYFAKSLLMTGSFYGKYISRNKINVHINKEIRTRDISAILGSLPESGKDSDLLTALAAIRDNSSRPALLEKILGDYRVLSQKELDQSRLLVKIGPMLGLMGTLIPMGPALVGLATGDISSMASNMQVAFATTVIGIVIGAVGFITLQVKQRWASDDMNILEYAVDALKEKETGR